MNTLVTIEHLVAERDHLTNRPAEWGVFAKFFGEGKSAGGSETAVDQQTTAIKTWTWRTHYTPQLAQVTEKMRLLLPSGQRQGIKTVLDEDVAHRVLIITAEETT